MHEPLNGPCCAVRETPVRCLLDSCEEIFGDQDWLLRMSTLIRRCKPTVERHWRLLLAGSVWFTVGIALVLTACYWLSRTEWPLSLLLAFLSPCIGLVISRFGFSRIAARNIERLQRQEKPACLFSFQGWRSYLLIFIMILFGYALRHMPIPRSINAVIYLTMGSALAFSSAHYLKAFAHE